MKRLLAGQQVDQFRIVRRLGRGGMSVVYLARDTMLGRKVALKIIRTDLADSPRRLKLFIREARHTAKFSHPHIITIYSVGQFERYPYLALEYLKGQTLGQRMRKGAMPVRETMRIGLAIAQALEEAHSHGVLHRDLKPANIIIPHDGRLRVLDFGISKIVDDDVHPFGQSIALPNHVKPEETAVGAIKGTPIYLAPERWLGEKITGAVDVWALGVILYTMLTQDYPFPGHDQRLEAIAKRIILTREPRVLPSELDVPPDFSRLVTSMLDNNASRRPTAKLVVEIIQGLLQHTRRALPFEKGNPFRGLLPFSERHADLFFGRNSEIEMAVERLRNEPILPVVGPSGVGKSSFVAAGIVPRLRELDSWLVLAVRPGTDPIGALSSIIQAGRRGDVGNTTSLSSAFAPMFDTKVADLKTGQDAPETNPCLTDPEVTKTATNRLLVENVEEYRKSQSSDTHGERAASAVGLAQNLLEGPAVLVLELQALADETQGKVLLFVDQLEELYTQEHAPHIRRAYMEAISRAADDPEGPIRVIFTVREDFLSRVAESPVARETLNQIMMLGAPEEEALYEVITKPVELAEYSYEDEALPREMLDAVRDAPSSLPILQFACSQLWNRRDSEKRLLTRAAYLAMGGVEGALARKADELLVGFSEVQQKVAKQLMLRLVTPEGTRRVRAAQELLDGLDSDAELVLDRLTAARMVVSRRAVGKRDTGTELELVHDSLIHSWKPLVRWLEQSREEVVFLDEISRAAELWDSRGRHKEEVWSGRALDEALAKFERCEAVPKRVTEFLETGEQQRLDTARNRRNIRFALFSALFAVIVVLTYMNRQTEIQRGLAVNERDRQQQAHASSLREGARAAYANGDFLEARSKLRASLETRDSSQARALWWLLENEPLVWSMTLDSASNRVSASPDGRLIAVSSRYINIYDTKTLERRVVSSHKRQVEGLDFSPNGQWLSSGSDDREIHLWDLREGTVRVLKGHTGVVWSAAYSPDGKRIVSGSDDTTIKIWDIESGTPIRTLQSKLRVWNVRYSPDGRFIISANLDEKVRLWNAQNFALEQVIEEPGMRLADAVISADGKLLAYAGSGGFLFVRDVETLQRMAIIPGIPENINSLSFSSDGDFIAASTKDGDVLVWDTKTWSLSRRFQHTQGMVNGVSFLPDRKQVVSAGSDGILKLWNIDVDSFRKESAGHSFRIYGLAFAPDGKTIATGSNVDGELRLWDVESGQSIRTIHGNNSDVLNIAYNHNGNLLAVGTADGAIRLYKLPEGELLKTLFGHRDGVTTVLFSQDGTQLVSSSWDRSIAFWDLESLTLKRSLTVERAINNIDIHPDGRFFASNDSKRIKIRDIETGQVLKTYSGHTNHVWSVAFSPDGKSLYSSSWDYTARRYLLGDESIHGEIVARHRGHIFWIDVTHSTHDILGTPSADGTAKLWKVGTRDFITLKGHQGEVNTIRFSPDGDRVATVCDDGTLRLWETKTGRPLWRAPLMLEEPPLLLAHQGRIGFEDESVPLPLTKQWQKAVDARGRLASVAADQRTLCLATFSDELEIWDIPNDERLFKGHNAEILQVVAIRKGCLTRVDGVLTLEKSNGERVTLGKQVEAMNRLESSVFVLQNGKVRVLDLDGNQQDEFSATRGASALTIVGDTIALGFPERRIEVWTRDGSSSRRDFDCREVESSPVTTIIPGPPGTMIAGFANGIVGIWSLETGERLYVQRLHGPVIHLLLRDQSLSAGTELGSRLQLDLSMFYRDYCELMECVWSRVPWIWQEGRPRFRERPPNHICARGKGDS